MNSRRYWHILKGGILRRPGVNLGILTAVVMLLIPLVVTVGCDEFVDCGDAPIEIRDDVLTVGDSTRLIVKSGNGGIEVTAGPEGEVRVQAELRVPDKIDYQVSQDGDTVTVEAKVKSGLWKGCVMANIVVTAPAATDVDLDTSNGRIVLSGIEGIGYMNTSNGRIFLYDVKGDYEGGTSNGAIELDIFEGLAVFETSNGRVDAHDVKGEFELETSNGRISFEGELEADGNNRLVTSNGDIDVELLGTPSVEIEVSTSNGEILTVLPITTSLVEKDHIIGTIGDGDADLYIGTSNGDVTIS